MNCKYAEQCKNVEQSIPEWQKDFREYINLLDIPRDDYNGIMEYIDEVPFAPQKTGRRIDKYKNGNRYCDKCGAVLEGDNWEWRNNYFCYHCGAKMEVEE